MLSETEEKLRQEFSDRGVVSGSGFFIRSADLKRFVDACVERGLAILGMDSFEKTEDDGSLVSLPEMAEFESTDLVWEEYRDNCNAPAVLYANSFEPAKNVYVNLTLVDRQGWDELNKKHARWNRLKES